MHKFCIFRVREGGGIGMMVVDALCTKEAEVAEVSNANLSKTNLTSRCKIKLCNCDSRGNSLRRQAGSTLRPCSAFIVVI